MTAEPAFSFDTLMYANRLKAVGVEAKIADTHAELQGEFMTSIITENLATKNDIIGLKNDITGVKNDITKLEQRLDAKIDALDQKFEYKFEALENRLILKLGSITVICSGVIVSLITIFHMIH